VEKIEILEEEIEEIGLGTIRIPVIMRGHGVETKEYFSFSANSSDERIIKRLKSVWHKRWETMKRREIHGPRVINIPRKMDWDEEAEKLYMDTQLMDEVQCGDSERRAIASGQAMHNLFEEPT